ncbi:MAG: M28 family peptidase [Bacteroidota bacterium]|nr:M28 family peptidase [Bacteroidota bacterium]
MNRNIVIMCLFAMCLLVACKKEATNNLTSTSVNYKNVKTPDFSADSAYNYVKKQCDFGARIPMSKAANDCAEWMINFLKEKADTVYVQEFSASLWNSEQVKGKNIIASFNLEATDRVLLCSHWDSRLWADQDKDSSLHHQPIIGANDGASGVGILLEIARLMKDKKTKQGLDIVLFDLEDQGTPEWAENTSEDQTDWCLGSQYWAKNTHLPYYRAKYGILLDMVGAKDIRFTKEYVSMSYAPMIMNNVWSVAKDLGYGNIFVDAQEGSVMDDHVFVNRYAKIPTIDIVQNSANGSFFPHWHTSKDNMDCISKESLYKVGKVVLTTFFAAEE